MAKQKRFFCIILAFALLFSTIIIPTSGVSALEAEQKCINITNKKGKDSQLLCLLGAEGANGNSNRQYVDYINAPRGERETADGTVVKASYTGDIGNTGLYYPESDKNGNPDIIGSVFTLTISVEKNGATETKNFTIIGCNTSFTNTYNPDDESLKCSQAITPDGQSPTRIEEMYNLLNSEIALMINSENPGEAPVVQEEHTINETSSAEVDEAQKISSDCSTVSALSWLFCPLSESLAAAVSNLYGKLIEPQLEMDANYVNSDAVVSVWGSFRDISNVLLVILILAVVISQVTGVGIDNYGIKKILPKIIVAAILINLSFIICQLSIDISNIVGKSIMNMFAGFASDVNVANNGGTAATIAALIGGVVAIIALPGIILDVGTLAGLIGGLISIIVSIIFLFILLVVRKAGVIALVMVSPIAFTLYMLPNTKKFFSKWLDAFSKLLLLFPICGLIMGVSTLLAKVFNSGTEVNDLHMGLVACIIAVAPVFLIPSVIKSTFNAFGKAGAALSNFGNRAGRFFGGMARNGAARSAGVNRFVNRENQRRAGKIVNRLGEKQKALEAQGKSLSGRRMYKLAAAQERAATAAAEEEKMRGIAADGNFVLAARENAKLQKEQEREQNKNLADAKYLEGRRLEATMSAIQERESKKALSKEAKVNPDLKSLDLSKIDMSKLDGTKLAAGLAGMAQFGAKERIAGASQFANTYRVDKSGNTLVQNSKGDWTGIDKKTGNRVSYSSSAAKDFKEISFAEAKSRGMDVMRAGDYGRTGGMAQSGFAKAAANSAAISGLGQSTDMGVATIQGGNDSVLKLRHDQANNMRTVLQSQATAGVAKADRGVETAKATNQRIIAEADNKAGVEVISQTNADIMAENRQTRAKVENAVGAVKLDYDATLAAAQSKQSAELLTAAIANMKSSTQNYDVDTMASQLSTILKSSSSDFASGGPKEYEFKALMEKLSTSGGYGQKTMVGILNDPSYGPDVRKIVAGTMQKMGDVSSAINKKDGAMAQYLRDVNVDGQILMSDGTTIKKASEISFDEWAKAKRGSINAAGTFVPNSETNESFVMSTVLTNDADIINQSTGAARRSFALLPRERIERIMANEQILRNADGDVLVALGKEAVAKGITLSPEMQTRLGYTPPAP